MTIDRRELIAGVGAVATAAAPAVAAAAVGIPHPEIDRLRGLLHQLFGLMRSDGFAVAKLNDGKILFWLEDRSDMASMAMMSLDEKPTPDVADALDRTAAIAPHRVR